MYIPNTPWTWAFMGVALAQAVIGVALESYVFAEFQIHLNHHADGDSNFSSQNVPVSRTIPTFLALYIFGFIYEIVLVWDALRLKNTIQVIGVCIYNVGMLIYASVEADQVHEAIRKLAGGQYAVNIDPSVWASLRPFLIAAPCVIALGTALLCVGAWKLYDEFAWTIYKHISADLALRRRFLQYQIYIALLKFDFFFFLGFTIQFLVDVPGTGLAEYIITIIAIPVVIILLLLAALFTRRESYLGQWSVIIISFAAMAYFVFKLVRMYDSPKEHYYNAARHELTTFAVLTLLLLVLTIIAAFMCMRNFKKGLRPHIQSRKVPNAGEIEASKRSNGYYGDNINGPPHPLGRVPPRMTID